MKTVFYLKHDIISRLHFVLFTLAEKMAESIEFSNPKIEKQIKYKDTQSKCSPPIIWSATEKLQLAEAIDMYGINFPKRLVTRVPTKTVKQVMQMLTELRIESRKEVEEIKKCPSFINFDDMDDLFLVGDTEPKDVLVKWMEYLERIYNKDPYIFNKFKLLSSSFLILSECTPPPKTTGPDVIDFRKVYYFLYRVINNYPIRKNHGDSRMRNYLHEMFLRVMNEIDFTSDEEKITMQKIVSNWTADNRSKSLRVYGKNNEIKTQQKQPKTETRPNLKTALELNVLENPMIPSFNPFQIKSKKSL